MKEFMQKYDKNSDGKIEMAEVSTWCWPGAVWRGSLSPVPLLGTHIS